jgi:hypothetical protein
MDSRPKSASEIRGRRTANRRVVLPGPGEGGPSFPAWAERRSTTRQPPRIETVSLVIPTKNEARSLFTVLEDVPDAVNEIILVDGLSSDVTEVMAKAVNPAVRIVRERSGEKGNALRTGVSNLQTFRDGARVIRTLFREQARAKRELSGEPNSLQGGEGATGGEAQGPAS